MRTRLATALFLIATSITAARADDPPGAIRGKAFVAGSDRAAARVALHFLDRDAPALSVMTDAGGRFLAAVPAGVSIAEGRDGDAGPPCWMEAPEPGRWTWQPIGLTPHLQPDYARKLLSEDLRQPVQTTWRRRAGVLNLEVRCPPTGEIEVLVRGAVGAPVADRPVQVIPAEGATGLRRIVPVRFDGRTDGAGRFRLRWFEGILRLKVVVPGEGFGSTGLIEVRTDRIARQETPPLVRLGSIEGRLDPKLAGPSMTVVLETRGNSVAEAACDAEGRFALGDVLPDTYRLRARRHGKETGSPVHMIVAPGQRLAGVAIGPERPAPPRPARGGPLFLGLFGRLSQPPTDRGKEVVWLEGTVRDEQGRGLAGARVFARTTIYSGHRTEPRTQATTTDDRGRYWMRGPRERMETPSVIAHAEGRPPALAFASTWGADGRSPVLDLTIPDARRGGSIRVTVLQDSRPMAGASVGLAPMDHPAPLTWDFDGRGPDIDAIRAVTHPSTVTGPDGVARFIGLLPGRYVLTAAEPGRAVPREFVPNLIIGRASGPEVDEAAPVFARARGVDVVEGRETPFVMAVHPQPCTVTFQVLDPDGSPLAGRRAVDLRYGLGSPSVSTSMELDGRGVGRFDFEWPGLWDVEVRFRDNGSNDTDVRTEPFYRAVALVPISPAMPLDQPIRMVGLHHGLGSIRVRLLDRDGLPARGAVLGVDLLDEPEFGATTDDRGVVVFRDLPQGEYRLLGYIDGRSAPVPDPAPSRPVPEDAALRGRAVVPFATAAVASGRETAIELRARPVGYVRGTLRPPAGHEASDHVISPAFDVKAVGSVLHFDPESGTFLHGPILPGRVDYRFLQWAEDGTLRKAGGQEVEVSAGDVTHVEFRPEEPKPGSAPASAGFEWPGQDVVRALEKEPGTVVLDDGRTPAFAARSLLFVPGWGHPVSTGFSDTSGRLRWRESWYVNSGEAVRRDGLVDRPTVVVWIPGRTGAVTREVVAGRPIRLTLPAPRVAGGRVTLGGRPVDGRNARIRVVAARRGRGVLDEALGLEATAQADGHFELRGLTPCRYDVQAGRDGIWLSRGIELTVADDRDPPPLALDIREPGRAVELRVVDREGRPAAGRPIGLVRPEGPLASLWPATLVTGPDGILTLRGMEAGRHAILIGGDQERREIVVPAVDGDATGPVIERIAVP